jgi:hypothetical protein
MLASGGVVLPGPDSSSSNKTIKAPNGSLLCGKRAQVGKFT